LISLARDIASPRVHFVVATLLLESAMARPPSVAVCTVDLSTE
jgi:hypothetical protein